MENKAAIFQSISVFRWLGRGTNRNSIRVNRPGRTFQINPQYDRISEDYIHQSIRKGSAFTLVESDHARYK